MATMTEIKLGPADHGRKMSLPEFEHIKVQPGYRYELGRGVIVVSDIPNPQPHLGLWTAARRQLGLYEAVHPSVIFGIYGGAECKILIDLLESERHPDLAIYMTAPPAGDSTAWEIWIPEIVIEIVSPDSIRRDHEEKPDEYLQFGVKEYWIIDAARGEMLVLRRSRGQWAEQIVRPPQTYQTPLLPGLEFDCGLVFAAVAPSRPRSKPRKKRNS